VTAATGNTGSSLIGATSVTSPAAYVAGNYNVTFTDPTHYTVTDSAVPPNNVSTGTYTDGSTITFNGQQITLTGTPAAGDSFAVSTSTNQSIFATVQNLVNTLQSQASTAPGAVTAVNNQIGNAINNIDQALTNTSNVQASVGGRLNSITTQQSVAGSQQVQLQTSISQLQSLDFASALTTLTQQQTTLSAALQAFQLTQGLTLFKFL
jgi:flagellar hook-associated protein 3 FlgL